MGKLFGHGLDSLYLEVFLVELVLVLLLLYLHAQSKEKRIQTVVWGLLLFFFMPNAPYLGVEIRHALMIDGVADGDDIVGKIFFVALGLIGFFIATNVILIVTNKTKFLKKEATASIVLLSFISAFGATLGVMGLTTVEGLLSPPKIVEYSIYIVTSWERFSFVFLLGTFQTLFGLFGKRLQEHFD